MQAFQLGARCTCENAANSLTSAYASASGLHGDNEEGETSFFLWTTAQRGWLRLFGAGQRTNSWHMHRRRLHYIYTLWYIWSACCVRERARIRSLCANGWFDGADDDLLPVWVRRSLIWCGSSRPNFSHAICSQPAPRSASFFSRECDESSDREIAFASSPTDTYHVCEIAPYAHGDVCLIWLAHLVQKWMQSCVEILLYLYNKWRQFRSINCSGENIMGGSLFFPVDPIYILVTLKILWQFESGVDFILLYLRADAFQSS